MKRVLILLFTAVVLSSNDCHKNDPLCGNDSHEALTIKNNSNKRISYAFYGYYPDTTIYGDHSPAYYSQSFIISPGSSHTSVAGWAGCFESVFTHNTKQWICFFDEDSVEQISWETIKLTNRGVLEKRQVTLDYLKTNNFTITYP
ncbi:MAG: hypothetical protein J7502_15305 [Flavisolibacter sp.]|nr:hypothetical protein [Flavisolibacter sp.]